MLLGLKWPQENYIISMCNFKRLIIVSQPEVSFVNSRVISTIAISDLWHLELSSQQKDRNHQGLKLHILTLI